MSVISALPEPTWLAGLTGEAQRRARLGWMLDLCALYGSPDGKMVTFSILCQYAPSAIGKAKHLGQMSPELANKIESYLGRDIITREALCPEIFATKE